MRVVGQLSRHEKAIRKRQICASFELLVSRIGSSLGSSLNNPRPETIVYCAKMCLVFSVLNVKSIYTLIPGEEKLGFGKMLDRFGRQKRFGAVSEE